MLHFITILEWFHIKWKPWIDIVTLSRFFWRLESVRENKKNASEDTIANLDK